MQNLEIYIDLDNVSFIQSVLIIECLLNKTTYLNKSIYFIANNYRIIALFKSDKNILSYLESYCHCKVYTLSVDEFKNSTDLTILNEIKLNYNSDSEYVVISSDKIFKRKLNNIKIISNKDFNDYITLSEVKNYISSKIISYWTYRSNNNKCLGYKCFKSINDIKYQHYLRLYLSMYNNFYQLLRVLGFRMNESTKEIISWK